MVWESLRPLPVTSGFAPRHQDLPFLLRPADRNGFPKHLLHGSAVRCFLLCSEMLLRPHRIMCYCSRGRFCRAVEKSRFFSGRHCHSKLLFRSASLIYLPIAYLWQSLRSCGFNPTMRLHYINLRWSLSLAQFCIQVIPEIH